MNDPLLSTKVNIPPVRSNLVSRGRLMDRLNEAVSSKLTLISAPAGFGKTTLISAWVQESRVPCAWLSLDADDNNLERFLSYAITALKAVSPKVGGTTLALLHSTQTSPVESVLTVLINELSSLSHDFCLVFDDYHLIDSQAVDAALAYLIEYVPQRMHLVLTSRSDPALPLSRLRARGQLLELRQADLRFTPEEAASFLNQNLGIRLTSQQIAALETRTEGWIAGLQLAALSMRGRENVEAFIGAFSGSHRFVIDYLADEVFSQQPEDLRQFLCETSILERFTASLCYTITGRDDSAVLLRMLEDTNLFLLALDDQREWYRYHHLFQDFLQTRLPEQKKADLNKKACQWFMSHGLATEAVKHAVVSGDLELTELVITRSAAKALKRGDFQTLLGWLDELPDPNVRANAVLSICKSYALLITRSYEDALPYAQAAEGSLTTEASSSVRGQFMSLKAQLALFENRLDDGIQYARDALEYLDDEDQFFRNLTLNGLGQIMEMKGDVASAADLYRQAFEEGWQAGDRLGALVVFMNLILSLNELGRRRDAVVWCERVVADIKSQVSDDVFFLDAVYLPWSLLEFEANELDRSREYSNRALEILRTANFSSGIIWAQYLLARIHLANHEYKSMVELTQAGGQLASQTGRENMQGAWFTALDAQASLDRGELTTALHWAENTGFTPQDSPHHWNEHPYFTYIRILLAQGQFNEARTLLDTMEKNIIQTGRWRKLITIHLLHAQALLDQDETPKAVDRVKRALELAAPQDYIRLFLDEGQKIAQLLPKARSAAPTFVNELMHAFQTPPVPPSSMDKLLEPLTEREQEVLELVAKGLSNRQIAEVMFVTSGTVKKHLNNIFSKLQVESRTQAIARGRELGVLKR